MAWIDELYSKVGSLNNTLGTKLNKLWDDIGDKNNLQAGLPKTNLVAAINAIALASAFSAGDHIEISSSKIIKLNIEDKKWIKSSDGVNRLKFGDSTTTNDILIRGKYSGAVDLKIQDSLGNNFLELLGSTLRVNSLSGTGNRLLMADQSGSLFPSNIDASDLATRTWVNSRGFAVNPTLQSVTDNNNVTTNPLDVKGAYYFGHQFYYDGFFEFLERSTGYMQKVAVGGLVSSDDSSDEVNIPTNGIYSKGTISTGSDGNSAQWKQAFDWGNHAGRYFKISQYNGNVNTFSNEGGYLETAINTPVSNGTGNIISFGHVSYKTSIFSTSTKNGDSYIKVDGDGGIGTWFRMWHYGNLADPATQTWVSNNFLGSNVANNTFVRKTGDIMTGILNVPALYSDTLTSTNKQLIQPNGSTIYWGNPQVNLHIFESTGANTLQHYVPGLGNGTIWTSHNFNPASKANANNTITINGSTQMLGNNPNFTISGGGTTTTLDPNGSGNPMSGNIPVFGLGSTNVFQANGNLYIQSGGGSGGGSAGFEEILPFTGIGGQPDSYTLFRVASRQTPYQGIFNNDQFTDLPPTSSLINVTGIYEGYEFDGSVGQRIISSGSFKLAQHAEQYARDNRLNDLYPYLVLLDDYQTNNVQAKWMSPVQVFQMHDWGNMRGGAKLIGYLVETGQHEICFEFNQQIIILREFFV